MEDTSKNIDDKEKQEGEENFSEMSKKENINSLKDALFKHKMNKSEQVKDNYKFWDTQPVPKIQNDDYDKIDTLTTNNNDEKERKEPLKLPNTFSWSDIDINNNSDLTKVKN